MCGVCRVVGTILTWLVSPFVLGGGAVILAFLLLVDQGQRAHFRRDREKLRAEFEAYRRQMQAKACLSPQRLIRCLPKAQGRVRNMQLMVTCQGSHAWRHAPWPVDGRQWHFSLSHCQRRYVGESMAARPA